MALNSTTRPSIRLRVLPRIPASFTAAGGLAVTKSGGVWTLEPDFSGLTELVTLLEPDSKDLWVWDPVTDVYNTLSIATLGSSLFIATSVTSNTIGTGAFTFATQAGKLFPVGGTVVISSDADPSTDYMVATVTSYSAAGSLVVNVPTGGNHGSGAHTDWTISLGGETGETGSTGATGATGASPAIGFTFDATSTADSDPGAGKVKFNHATPASITVIYFDNADADTNTVTAWLDSFDDSTTTAKGTLTFTDEAAPATKMIFSVSGSVVDGTGYRKVTVAHVSGATLFTTAHRLAVQFSRTGDKGADGAGTGNVVGPAASIDGEIALYDSTTGKLLKRATSTGALVATSGVLGTDATLTALAAYNTNGLLTQTAADTFAGRTITGTASQITVTNGDGVSGNPTLSLAAVPSFSVHKNAVDQTGVADVTFTEITWPTEVYDIGGFFASNGWTPPAGKVNMSAAFLISGTFAASSLVAIAIYKDGASLGQANVYSGTNVGSPFISRDDVANGSNVYTVRAYVDLTSGTGTISGAAVSTFFTGHWICP
jgi:hypothetical protein